MQITNYASLCIKFVPFLSITIKKMCKKIDFMKIILLLYINTILSHASGYQILLACMYHIP